jgi:hypothetical protein
VKNPVFSLVYKVNGFFTSFRMTHNNTLSTGC